MGFNIPMSEVGYLGLAASSLAWNEQGRAQAAAAVGNELEKSRSLTKSQLNELKKQKGLANLKNQTKQQGKGSTPGEASGHNGQKYRSQKGQGQGKGPGKGTKCTGKGRGSGGKSGGKASSKGTAPMKGRGKKGHWPLQSGGLWTSCCQTLAH